MRSSIERIPKKEWLATLFAVIIILPTSARDLPLNSFSTLQKRAQALEEKGSWYEACSTYDQILIQDRNRAEIRKAFQRCLRHFRQEKRHRNQALQQSSLAMTSSESLDLYQEAVSVLSEVYVDRARATITKLYREGLKELQSALEKKEFIKLYLGDVRLSRLRSFREQLKEWFKQEIRDGYEAREKAREIILRAADINLRPGIVILELASGACHSLDEYTCYLSPTKLNQLQSSRKNKHIGIGVELSVHRRGLVISRVHQKSPAQQMGLTRGDRIVRVNGQWLDPLNPDAAMQELQGPTGSTVSLDVIQKGSKQPISVKVTRQAFTASSVEYRRIEADEGRYLGYVRVFHFQSSTVQEVKDAVAQLQAMAVEELILDLRGNPGGAFRSGLGVAELFLSEGVITHTVSPLPGWTRTYRVQNPAAVTMGMVVLINGSTASSAEVVAGALKDNERATLIGRTTFGKASIQCSIPLEKAPGGLHLTFARFTTPSQRSLHGQGVVPDLAIDQETQILKAAIQFFTPSMNMDMSMRQ